MRSKHNSKRIRTLRRRRLALALVTAMAAPIAVAQNLPDYGTVTSGNATIGAPAGNQMTITQTTKGAIIDWGSFNIGNGYGVAFDQQFGNTSVTLNRVIGYGNGPGMSLIDGTLTSNGNVFIINPAGIVFGSGAQVNVGGLVASTLAIDDADFLSGVASGQYRFSANGSVAGAIWNDGQLTAADGGTIALIGSQINNAGTISATNGSVVFGATSQVTLDFFGDGLTQVTVSGNGLGVSNCSLDCNGGINSSGNVFAEGGHIEMRSNTMDGASAGNGLFVDPANGGRIWISGNVSARTAGTRRGSVVIDAGMGNIDLGGVDGQTGNVSANANNAGEDAGTIELRGNQLFTHLCYGTGPTDLCNADNRLGLVNASAFGTGGSAGEIHIDVNHLYHGGVLQAIAGDGSGGLIDIKADYAEIYNRIFAFGNNGAGGTINIDANDLLLFRGQQSWLGGPGIAYWSASLLAYGTTTGGAVNIDAGNLVVTDLGNVTPEFADLTPVINVTGQLGGNGGTINVNADYVSIDDTLFADASGEGQGGTIAITADSMYLAGGLVATGATGATGGMVTTTVTSALFADASAYVNAGTWLVHAPSVDIVPADDPMSGYGAVLTDAALSSTLDGGTAIQLFADAALGQSGTGDIHIASGVDIVHTTGDAAALDMLATGSIYGSYFNIESIAGPLDLSFTANVNGDNPYDGVVSFFYANLTSNGGDIAMHADGGGVYLEYIQVSSGTGDITIFGSGDDNGVLLQATTLASAGGDISIDASSTYGAAARLSGAGIASEGGNITIHGDGPDGVSVMYSNLSSAGGDILVDGAGIYSGVYFGTSSVDSAEGNITITGSASLEAAGYYPFGVALAGTTLTSTSGDISVIGDAVGGRGLQFWSVYDEVEQVFTYSSLTTGSGAISLTSTGASGLGLEDLEISTDTGDITIFGSASDINATAGVFVDSSGLTTNGGDISITGSTAGGTGVWVYYGDLYSNGGDITIVGDGFHYGVQVWDGLVSSGAGNTSIMGTATGSGSTGVNVRDASFASTSGGITINGAAEFGAGVVFGSTGYGPGSSVTTTSGGISVISTGLSGLDVADVPFSTDTGNITLQGTATGTDAGVYVGSGGLHTNGGDISINGSSAGNYGVWVNGDVSSAGGNISIYGERAGLGACGLAYCYGVLVSDAEIDSAGGDIVISGMDTDSIVGVGLALHDATLSSSGGAISLYGSSNALVGVGIYTSNVDSAGGDLTVTGNASAGYFGVALVDSDFTSGAGDTSIQGSAPNGTGVNFSGSSVITTSGAISVISTGLFGLSLANVPITTGSGDITLEGHALGNSFGVSIGLGAGPLVTNGGNITIIGSSVDSTGVFISGADVSSGGGDITIAGSSTNRAGAQVSGSDLDSAGGNITIHGESLSSTGLIVSGANLASGAGSIDLSGIGAGFGPGVSIGQESSVFTTSGDIDIDGTSSTYIGVLLNAGDVTTTTGNIDITGTGGTVGVRLASGDLATTSGDINVSGMGGSDAGLRFDASSTLDAGSGVVALAASNAGTSDAIILQGSIASTTGVNLRPLNEAGTILLGTGNGFSLSNADLATISAPLLVIGSAEHAGAIRVTEAVDWDDDLTLQNEGGNGGIDIQAAVDVGDNTLALASGGNISQTSAGGITAHSLLAIAGGDVTLTAAQNNVAASSIAGSAGGDFAYEDIDDLAIGDVSSFGFSSVDNAGFVSLSATGIAAMDSVLVRTATGNLTLGADVSGSHIDLVAAGLFFNPVGASLTASNGWRIYASTPDGEERGGLQGDGQFDVFGCSFGDEVCTGFGEGNQFIYQEPRLLLVPIAPEAVAELFDEDDLDGTATDLLIAELCPVADTGDLLQSAAGKDELAQQWMKSRRRLQLSNCIDNDNVPGCRF